MLQVQNGQVRVRSNIVEPYMGEPLEQVVQAFPVLVTNGQASYANPENDRISRRTVAGQDSFGRIVLMVSSSFVGMRLVDLSNYLPTTDLDLVTAVNLDGGGSSLMAITVPTQFQILSFDPVPAVLAVYAR
jgi:exopolysaccharide biosynthesis protein